MQGPLRGNSLLNKFDAPINQSHQSITSSTSNQSIISITSITSFNHINRSHQSINHIYQSHQSFLLLVGHTTLPAGKTQATCHRRLGQRQTTSPCRNLNAQRFVQYSHHLFTCFHPFVHRVCACIPLLQVSRIV